MRRLLMGMLLAVSVSACGDGPSGLTATSGHAGTYTLRTINGQVLPTTIDSDATARLDVASGSVTLRADGTFTDQTEFRLVSGTSTTTETDVITGTYTRTGGTVTFSPSDGGTYSMSFTGGNTLTQTIDSFVLVYRK